MPHWNKMLAVYEVLEHVSLERVQRVRSQQKAANCDISLAKMNILRDNLL